MILVIEIDNSSILGEISKACEITRAVDIRSSHIEDCSCHNTHHSDHEHDLDESETFT